MSITIFKKNNTRKLFNSGIKLPARNEKRTIDQNVKNVVKGHVNIIQLLL